MDLKLKPFDFNQAVARAGLRPDGTPLSSAGALPGPAIGGLRGRGVAGAAQVEAPSFQSEMTQALKAVSQSQADAARMQREVQLDNPTVSLEQTMVAMQKSQIGFQAVLQVRNRLVQAYSEIMNMQV